MKHEGGKKGWLLLAAVALGAGAYALFTRGGPPVSPGASAGAPASLPVPLVVPDTQTLVGQWMRTDYDYMIWIEGVAPDGRLRARYLNPQPINLARAEFKLEDGQLRLLVEMRDRNYPGSYYTLTYDPGSDGLFGVYHQLVQNQEFEVAFYRFDPKQPRSAR